MSIADVLRRKKKLSTPQYSVLMNRLLEEMRDVVDSGTFLMGREGHANVEDFKRRGAEYVRQSETFWATWKEMFGCRPEDSRLRWSHGLIIRYARVPVQEVQESIAIMQARKIGDHRKANALMISADKKSDESVQLADRLFAMCNNLKTQHPALYQELDFPDWLFEEDE